MHHSYLKNHTCVLVWISRSNAREGVKFKHLASWLGWKDWETWFFNSYNSKTRLKIMKLGMVSWHGTNMLLQFFWPNWDKLWCKLLANRSFPQEGSWFREGTCQPRVRNNIRTLPSTTLIFLHRQIRPNRSIMLNFGIIPCSFGLFYTLIEILRI